MRTDNFVPALRDPAPRVVEVEILRELPSPPATVLLPQAGYVDRATGFTVATMPLAGVVGFCVALVAVVGFAVPIASLVTLLAALAGFCVTWLLAYVAHVAVSPDGAIYAQSNANAMRAIGRCGHDVHQRRCRHA